MKFSKKFIKKLKEVYPYSIFPQLAKTGDYSELSKYLLEEDDAPSINCEDILEYINEGRIEELKAQAEENLAYSIKKQEIYSMFVDEIENALGMSFEK